MNNIPLMRAWGIPGGIVLFSFLLRLFLISRGPYNIDSVFLVDRVLETIRTGILQHDALPGYPLSVILATIFVLAGKVFGLDPALSFNFESVLLSSLAIWVFYHFVKNLLDENTAVFSSILLSFCPVYLGLSVYGKSHIPAVLFLFLTLHWLLLFRKTALRKYLWSSIAAYGCMGATREHDFLLMLVPITFFFFFVGASQRRPGELSRARKLIKHYFLFVLGAMIIAVVFHFPYFFGPVRESYLGQYQREWQSGVMDNFLGFLSPSLSTSYRLLLANFYFPGFLFFIGGLMLLLLRKEYRLALFLLLWIIVPLGFYGNLLMTVTPRYFVFFLPPFLVVMAFFFSSFQSARILIRAMCWGFFAFLILLWFGRMAPILHFRHQHAVTPDFGKWVGKVTENNAVVITTDESWFIRFYARRQVLGKPVSMECYHPGQLAAFQEKVDALLQEETPVYITSVAVKSYDWCHEFPTFLQQNYRLTYIGSHLFEDWHNGEMAFRVEVCDLFRLERK